jgi:hypothetical protein
VNLPAYFKFPIIYEGACFMPTKMPSETKKRIIQQAIAYVHLFLSEKGGEGKSTLAHLLIEYLIFLLKTLVIIVEGDRSQPDIKRLFQNLVGHPDYSTLVEITHGFYSEDIRLRGMGDQIWESALKTPNSHVIWNTPANVSTALFQALHEDGLIEFAADNRIGIINWCVTSGNSDAIRHFLRCLKEFPTMTHILVKNYGLNDDFTDLERNDELQAAIKAHRVPVIELPAIPYEELKIIKAHNLTFTQGIKVIRQTKGAISSHRLQRFFNQACAQIEASGVFHAPQS